MIYILTYSVVKDINITKIIKEIVSMYCSPVHPAGVYHNNTYSNKKLSFKKAVLVASSLHIMLNPEDMGMALGRWRLALMWDWGRD